MVKKGLFLIFCLLILLSYTSFSYAQDQWKPTKPITIIVPWGAGGSTDQITRVLAAELEPELGQKIVIVNQPGGSGSVGTKTAKDANKDGYTWTSGMVGDLGTYAIKGFLDTIIEDWHLYLGIANVDVVSVNPDTPYQTFADLLQAFKDKPGEIPVATAGETSAGHTGMELIRKHTGIEYKHLTYEGGNPAVIATVRGETEVVPQLACEQVDMIKAGKLRPLAVLDSKALDLEGYGEIPSVIRWIPEFVSAPLYFGIFIPKGVPEEVIYTMNRIWEEKIKESEAVKNYARDSGAVFTPYWGTEALVKSFPLIQNSAWLYYDAGKAEISPFEIGIPRS
ncbi:MAG: tripartite tricarboxylate transporter substrate binding protein [Bacteroidales bacterium]|nr:tripartite tricarboxylate transporter substrate binding protein [Bacteroidales bacterium]